MESPCRSCEKHSKAFPKCFDEGCKRIHDFQIASVKRRYGELINFECDETTEYYIMTTEVIS